jgi:hypothetical protein
MITFEEPDEFEWDAGNQDKNWQKHQVSCEEAEQAFTDEKRKIFTDKLHFNGEERFRVVGKTEGARLLFIVFTVRKSKIRIISVRDINRKERNLYEEKT